MFKKRGRRTAGYKLRVVPEAYEASNGKRKQRGQEAEFCEQIGRLKVELKWLK